MSTQELLPLGSVVYLEEGKLALMIVSRQPLVDLGKGQIYFDYAAVSQILGLEPENIVYFNHENISKVVFTGYISDEEPRIQEAIAEWRDKHPDIPKGNVDNYQKGDSDSSPKISSINPFR